MPLREALLWIIVGVLCLGALIRPRIGLYGYVWFAVLRPDVLSYCQDGRPFSLALALCTAVSSLRYYQRVPAILSNPIIRGLLALQIPLALSVVTAVNTNLAAPAYWAYLRMLLVLSFIPILIQTEHELKHLLLVIAGSVGLLGSKFGIAGVAHGGVLWDQGYGENLWDNNQLGLAFVMAVPLCWYGRTLVQSSWAKWGLLIAALASMAAVIMTNSRGSSIALGVALLLMAWHSERKVLTFCVLVLAAAGAIYMMRATYINRMMTLRDVTSERSAASRLDQARAAVAIWRDYPLLGVGFGRKNYSHIVGRYLGSTENHVAHNSYLQMLADSGAFAFILYAGLLLGSVFWLRAACPRAKRDHPELAGVPAGLLCALGAFIVGSAFYSFGEYDLPYVLLLCAAAWWALERSMESDVPQPDEDGM